MTYFQAIVIGLLQGVTELFPVSSLGHSVLLPAWLGWDAISAGQAADESFYLAFLVGLHCATALALLWNFREEWARIIKGFFGSLRSRKIDNADARLAWYVVIATIPVGLVGLVFEHSLRTLFAKPLAAAIFLTINGALLLGFERLRRRVAGTEGRQISELTTTDALIVGSSQIGALFAGISRSGITMGTGLLRGLDHEDAAHFAFLLATPVILAAGLYKLPDLVGHNSDGLHGQILVGSLVAGVAALFTVRFLTKFFHHRTLTPFGIYCLAAGALSILRFM